MRRRLPSRICLFALLFTILAASQAFGAPASAGGARWSVPGRWKEKPERPMRVATYAVPAAGGAAEAECAVFYFGKGQGGSVEENLSRWAKQFDGGQPKTETKTVAGLRVHVTDVSGTYLAAGGPMMQTQEKRPGYRLLGAIVETPEGLVFFKLTGPAVTVAAARTDFDALVRSLTKAPNI